MRCLSIGLCFETFETYPVRPGDPPDAHVEYEPESTIEALEAAIQSLGHRPVRLGSPHALLDLLAGGGRPGVDAVLNLAEGHGSRNREAWAPILLEMAGIPALGSDALSLSMSLDKAWANRLVASAGIRTAPFCVIDDPELAYGGPLPAPFPLFVKPRWEGTAKGIRRSSKVTSRAELAGEVERIVRDYRQPALVEAFLPGAEYTVTIIGNRPPRALPTVQRALDRASGIGLHALEGPGRTGTAALEPITPGALEPELERTLAAMALQAFALFECLDFARIDFRIDAQGLPAFLEINPLPTFATDGTFAILAEIEGCTLPEMLARCVRAGLERLRLPTEADAAIAPATPAVANRNAGRERTAAGSAGIR